MLPRYSMPYLTSDHSMHTEIMSVLSAMRKLRLKRTSTGTGPMEIKCQPYQYRHISNNIAAVKPN